ncbi:hypothetical protein AB0I35_07940 [Nocardia sp. NPDC050378]|uniref:hypothetical protein n=1 Tax=Nocardia sp. NPDC050378 TaxID=3155400 RepID=UPI0033FAE01F
MKVVRTFFSAFAVAAAGSGWVGGIGTAQAQADSFTDHGACVATAEQMNADKIAREQEELSTHGTYYSFECVADGTVNGEPRWRIETRESST